MRGIGLTLPLRCKMQPEKHGITEAAHFKGIDNFYDAFIARFEALNKKI